MKIMDVMKKHLKYFYSRIQKNSILRSGKFEIIIIFFVLLLEGFFMFEKNFTSVKRVSLFTNAFATTNPEFININELMSRIKNGYYKDTVEFARHLKKNDSKAQYTNFKKSGVPGFTMSALCKNRKMDTIDNNHNKLISHTGLLQIDIDNLTDEQMLNLLPTLKKDKYFHFVFISIGGNGIKAGIQINPEYHTESFNQVYKYLQYNYNIAIDKSVKDVYRLCFISDDEDLYYNPESEMFIYEPSKQEIKRITQVQNIKSPIENKGRKQLVNLKLNWLKDYFINNATTGNRHNTRAKVSYLAGGYVSGGICKQEEIFPILLELSDSVADANKTNASELKTINDCFEDGIKFPINIETGFKKLEDWYSDHKRSERSQREEFIRNYNLPYCYWNEILVHGQMTLIINLDELFEFIINNKGINQMNIDGQLKARIIVKIEKNIVTIIDESLIRNKLTNDWLDELPVKISDTFTKFDLRSKLRKEITRIIEKSKLDVLPIIVKDEFIRDKKNEAYFFFKNGFVFVNKNVICLKDYSELNGYIWESQIIEHDFELLTNDSQSLCNFSFTKFLKKICSIREPEEKFDSQRYNSLITVIGYLLHNYRSKSYNKAIVLMDAAICEEPQGRTGKGLIMQAISTMRNVATLDGRNFTFDSTFTFQNVDFDTNIIFIDDINKKFDFHRLFSVITEGVSFEKKYQQRVILKPEKSPKIVISSNYSLPGNSESERGRKFEMELLPYFNSEYRPCDEFGEDFFTSWDIDSYNTFFNVMINCVKSYFQNNCMIPHYDSSTINQKKLLTATTQEFIDYMNTVDRNKVTVCEDFYNNFVTMYGYSNLDKDRPTNKMVSKWLQYYCNINNIELNTIQSKVHGINHKCYVLSTK